eukprot:5004806-Amphidinium_carterae.1
MPLTVIAATNSSVDSGLLGMCSTFPPPAAGYVSWWQHKGPPARSICQMPKWMLRNIFLFVSGACAQLAVHLMHVVLNVANAKPSCEHDPLYVPHGVVEWVSTHFRPYSAYRFCWVPQAKPSIKCLSDSIILNWAPSTYV